MKISPICIAAVLSLTVGISGSVAAQELGGYYSGMAFNGLIANQTAITQTGIARAATRKVQAGLEQALVEGRSVANANSVALRFTDSEPARSRNYAQFVQRSRRADPAGADNLAATLAGDPIAQMGPELAKVGLTTNNVADAYTVYWVEAWEAAHGFTSEGSREQAQAVKRQAAAAILDTPEFQRATDAQKQEFADALLVQALLIGAAKDQAGGDRTKLRQIGNAVRQGAKATGLDLDAMTLTENGFVPAKRTGSADPAPGAEREALAAKESSGDHPSYGFLAAAGGAGLGAAFLIGKAMGRKG